MKLSKFLIVFIFFCGLIVSTGKAQVTLTVTDVVLANSSGSLDSVLYVAIDSANTGNDVIVRFNASGLIQVGAYLPTIDISQGSITLDKHPSASVTQGLQFTAASNDPTVQYGIIISNNDSSSRVLIKNLAFEDFRSYSTFPGVDRGAVYISNGENVEITDCQFDYNTRGTYLNNSSSNIRVHYNSFNLDTVNVGVGVYSNALYYYNNANCYEENQIYFDHNVVNNSLTPNSTAYSVAVYYTPVGDYIDSTSLYVSSNTINNCYAAVYLFNNIGANFTSYFKPFINDNQINSCYYGIALVKPLDYWSVQGNVFSSLANSNTRQIDLLIQEIHKVHEVPHINGIDFIESNTLGYATFNTGNQWLDTSVYAIASIGVFEQGVNLVGLDLTGRVLIQTGKYTTVRENNIRGTSPVIDLVSGGNGLIASPTIVSSALYGSALEVRYQLNGALHVQNNAEFSIDFYKSNSTYHLRDYIGNETIDSITGGTYTSLIPIPAGVSLAVGDTIALTVTSYGNLSGPDTAIGTSEAAFTSIRPFCCDSFAFRNSDSTMCLGHPLSLTFIQVDCGDTLAVDFGDGNDTLLAISGSAILLEHTYDTLGTYSVSAAVSNSSEDCIPISDTINITVRNCEDPVCSDCLPSFSPIPGKKYLLSAWVKEEGAGPAKTDYTYPEIIVSFPSDTVTLSAFTPKGAIIDGWQRVEEAFTIPSTSTDIAIQLKSTHGNCFFDDIRVLPFDGSLKSFVYDPVSLKLVAELDERNYATLYEYDEEGKLVRVKKETEKGIMTIKENRSMTQK